MYSVISRFIKYHKDIYKGINVSVLNRSVSFTTSDTNAKNDVVIVGGGIIGYSTAYWLKSQQPNLKVTIIERDTKYAKGSTLLSVGGVRQQFSEPENILMSMFCSHIFSNMNQYFAVNGNDNLDVQFIKRGYLVLSSEKGIANLLSNYETQKGLGAKVIMMSKKEMIHKWPWMNFEDVSCGVHGIDNEGWFDPWSLLCVVRAKTRSLGVCLIDGEVISMDGDKGILKSAKIKTLDGGIEDIDFSILVNASGAWANEVASMGEKGIGLSGSQFPLHVKKCKRYVFNCCCPSFPKETTTPMVIDHTGVYFRKESSGDFICGLSPTEEEEPSCDDLDVDYEWFEDRIWHHLFHRVPSMEAMKVRSAWAGFYDYNTKDQNLIIGRHPAIDNMILCNGSSGHGIQHALAIGRANMEMILYNEFRTIDLRRLSYQRFLKNELIFEKNIF